MTHKLYKDYSMEERLWSYHTICDRLRLTVDRHRTPITDPMILDLEQRMKDTKDLPEWQQKITGNMVKNLGWVLYDLIRIIQPRYVLETGVARGASTAYILTAMHRNDWGLLESVEILEECGILVNDPLLQRRWACHKGKPSSEVLPHLLNRYDIFIHDSLHSYDNMMFELEWAEIHTTPTGLILCHDINMNDAFFDFCAKYNHTPYFLPSSVKGFTMGITLKNEYTYKQKSVADAIDLDAWLLP